MTSTDATGSAGREALIAYYRRSAFVVVLWQVVVTVAFGAVGAIWCAAVGDSSDAWRAARSALAGGGACALPSAYLARRMFKFPPGASPRTIVRAFYVGEAAKVGLGIALLAIALIALDLNHPIFLLTYIAALSVFWFALLGTATSAPGDLPQRGHR